MRVPFQAQQSLDFLPPVHSTPRTQRYAAFHRILGADLTILDAVQADLMQGLRNPLTGRKGLTAEQVLRFMVVKQVENLSYRELAEQVSDSATLRRFCLLGDAPCPSFKTLNDNIKRLRPETLEKVNQKLLQSAREEGIEKGEKYRVDCTGVETNVHYPTDNSLIWDCVRVATRLAQNARKEVLPELQFPDHQRAVKKLHFRIVNTKGRNAGEKRKQAYRRLFRYGHQVIKNLNNLHQSLNNAIEINVRIMVLRTKVERFLDLFVKVISQAERRLLHGEKVPANEKILSVFEVHTDIIEKGDREPVFGHKICLATGKSGLVFDCLMPEGNPADSTLFLDMLERHVTSYGEAPRKCAADGGFASGENVEKAREMGVDDVLFTKGKGRGAKPLRSVKSDWVARQLARFRAGIEGNISTLKRKLGLSRCTWKGWESFRSYVWACIIGYNLKVMALALS